MVEFIKKAMDWILEKEADAARNCHAKPEEVDKQIHMIEERRDSLKKSYEENIAEFEHILNKLHSIKAASLKCSTTNK